MNKKEIVDEKLRNDFLLEQYRQAWRQRHREANVQMQLLGIGNTILAGLLIVALTIKDQTVSAIVSGAVIPIGFFLYITNRKHKYFEDLFSENIEAIEKQIVGIKHMQYDTFPQKESSLYYFVRYPKKFALERVIPTAIMNTIILIYIVAAHLVLFKYGCSFLPKWVVSMVVCSILPICYSLTFLINTPARLGENDKNAT